MTQMDPIVIVGGALLGVAGVAWYFLCGRYYTEEELTVQ